jgi:mannose-1-phosphate guanylyltransferase
MITVIIAGGSGTRLWPLSTPGYPKHLLSLTGRESLLHYCYERAKTVSHATYVLTEASHAHHVRQQLPQLPKGAFIIEPARRGTASCIVAALGHIAKTHDTKEPVAFLAADHYIRDTAGFTQSFKVAGNVSKKSGRIVLVGAEPTYPATGFGYIQKGGVYDKQDFVFDVKAFKEKPDYATAQKYVASGDYLWNCGYFVGSVEVFLAAMKASAPELLKSYEKLQQAKNAKQHEGTYLDFTATSIDYALIEKVRDLLVVPAAFDWMDLGSYGDLHKAVESNEEGNHIRGGQIEVAAVTNSFIQNHEDKPVAVIGLDNIAVVNTNEGLLVTRKDLAQEVGEISKRFKRG